jgi:lactoylglutathione lyase
VILRKIDCVMRRVRDLDAAVSYYAEAFGLRPLWRDEASVGMGLPETDAEIVLHVVDGIPDGAVHYLVDDVRAAAASFPGVVRTAPFQVAIGWCAAVEDQDGNPLFLIDMTSGPRRGEDV